MVWEQCLSISGPVLAAAGVCIAWQQKRIADIRLRHDLYDRKYRVYEAAKTLLVNFQDNGALSQADYFNYLHGVADAIFLFDEDIEGYLKTLRDRAIQLIRLQRNGAPAADESAEIEVWFTQQFGVLASTFRPFMRLDPPSLAERIARWFGWTGWPGLRKPMTCYNSK